MSGDFATDEDVGDLLSEYRRAVADDLRSLAVLHDREPDQALLKALAAADFPDGMGIRLCSPRGREARALMRQALAEIEVPAGQATLDALAVDYADIYLTHGFRASPMESVWLDDDNLARQAPMFEVRADYRRHGLAAADWRNRPDDHLVLELEFVAHLLGNGDDEASLQAAATFLDRHLLRWLDDFATRVAQRCNTAYFAALALLTAAYLEALRAALTALTLGSDRDCGLPTDRDAAAEAGERSGQTDPPAARTP